MRPDQLRLLVSTVLLVLAVSSFGGTASARADVCDHIPSIPLVPNPVKAGCKTAGTVLGAAPKLLTNPGGAVKDIVTAPFKAAGDEVMKGVTTWVAEGAGWLVGQAGKLIDETTTPRITSLWFLRQYRSMGALAAVFALPLLLISIIQGVLRRQPGVILRAAFVQLPLAFLLAAIAVTIVQLLLQLTDEMSAAVSSSVGSDAEQFFKDSGKALADVSSTSGGASPVPLFAVFLGALVAAAGAFCVWLELLVRSGAIYVALLFLPFTFVAMIWPATASWCRRLIEILVAVILSKFVIVAIMALAAAGLGQSRGDEAFQGVLAGAALMVLAAFSPFVLLRLIPFAESAAVGVGWRRGALGGALVGPVASPSMVMRRAMYSYWGSGGASASRGPSLGSPVLTAGGAAATGGASVSARMGVARAPSTATTSRVAALAGSETSHVGGQDSGSSGAGRQGASTSAGPRTPRPTVEGPPSPSPRPPDPPPPRPRDGEGGL
jgi:hypothetical protein